MLRINLSAGGGRLSMRTDTEARRVHNIYNHLKENEYSKK
jgi:hypothetical protein